MPKTFARMVALGAAIGGAALLSACAESRLRLSNDYGEAVRQDAAAQIADPDAHYVGTPAPGSNGQRVELAQKRYVTGKVLRPPAAGTTASLATGGGGGGGGGGSGGEGEGGGDSASMGAGP
jgi:hypothetical protein